MPFIRQDIVRTSQPQQAVRVKSEFYGTRAWLPGLLEASRQSDGILPNNAISQLGVSGKLTHAVAESFQLDSSAGFIPTAGGYTLALHFVYGGALGSGQGVGPRVVGGSLSLRATPYFGSSGIVSWDYGGATEGVSRCSAALPTSDGTIAAYVFTTGPRGMEIWSNGNKAASNAANPTRSDTSAYIYAVGDMYGGDSGSESFALVASIPYQVSEDVAQALSANPWQIFEDEEDYIWVPDVGGGGGATALDGHAAAIASAAGALSVAVPITGAAVAVITVNGALSTALPLSGAAAAVSNAGGTLKIGIALSGAAIAQAVAGGTIGAGFALSGNAQAVAAANGSIKIQVAIAGSAIAQASASGNLGVSGGNALAGNAAAQSSATGGLSTSLPLAGLAQVIATASGNLTTGTPLSGAAVAVAAASGNLVVTVALSGAAVAQAIAQGGLSLSVPLSGAAVAQAAASGILSGSGIITGPSYGRLATSAQPLTPLTSTARHLTTLLHGAAHV